MDENGFFPGPDSKKFVRSLIAKNAKILFRVRWRQYAAAVLFQGRKGLSPLGMEEDDDDAGDDEGAEGDAEEFRGRRTTVTYRVGPESPKNLKNS